MVGRINIHGDIGSYIDPSGKMVKGVELIDVIQQVKAQPRATNWLVGIKSPGGLVDVGDQIYDYLESLGAVDTISDGDIGSIATKLFLVGQRRTIVRGHEFFIHNPWMQPQAGDSNKITAEVIGLRDAEQKLRSFYVAKTGVTDKGLAGLMDNETGMNSSQAVALGFATEESGGGVLLPAKRKVKAFALLKTNISMTKTAQTPGQKFGAMIGEVFDSLLGNKPAIKALTLQIEGQGAIEVGAEDPANAVGAPVTDATGAPLADGEYKTADGQVLKVSGGNVAELSAAPAAAAPAAAPAATPAPAAAPAAVPAAAAPAPAPVTTPGLTLEALAAKIEALEKGNKELAKAGEDKIAAAITELKNTLGTGGRGPAMGINSTGGANKVSLSPVQAKMKQNQEAQNAQSK